VAVKLVLQEQAAQAVLQASQEPLALLVPLVLLDLLERQALLVLLERQAYKVLQVLQEPLALLVLLERPALLDLQVRLV
jgi:hypothetical protein